MLFVDGVRRVEARVWLDDGAGGAHPGICATFAAGAVRCDGTARVGPVIVGRGLFTSFGQAESVTPGQGSSPSRFAAGEGAEALSLALQERMGEAEVTAAEAASDAGPADLRGDRRATARTPTPEPRRGLREDTPRRLPARQSSMRSSVRWPPGNVLRSSSSGRAGAGWPGTSDFPGDGNPLVRRRALRVLARPNRCPQAIALADRVTRTLPRFASEPHKEAQSAAKPLPDRGSRTRAAPAHGRSPGPDLPGAAPIGCRQCSRRVNPNDYP